MILFKRNIFGYQCNYLVMSRYGTIMIESLKKTVGAENVLYGGAEKARFSLVWATYIPLPNASRVL